MLFVYFFFLNAFLKIEGIVFGLFLNLVIKLDFLFPNIAVLKLGVLPNRIVLILFLFPKILVNGLFRFPNKNVINFIDL